MVVILLNFIKSMDNPENLIDIFMPTMPSVYVIELLANHSCFGINIMTFIVFSTSSNPSLSLPAGTAGSVPALPPRLSDVEVKSERFAGTKPPGLCVGRVTL